ncbi:MAG: hypothetical protein RL516_399 [Bacteroidota bacterium]|jgi:hypothetical protein
MNIYLLALILIIILILLLKLKFKIIPEWSFKEIFPTFFWGYFLCLLISYFFVDVIERKILIVEDFGKYHYEYEYLSFKSDKIVNNSKYNLYLEKVIYQSNYEAIENQYKNQSYIITIKSKKSQEFDLNKIGYILDNDPPYKKMVSIHSGKEIETYWLHFDLTEVVKSLNY